MKIFSLLITSVLICLSWVHCGSDLPKRNSLFRFRNDLSTDFLSRNQRLWIRTEPLSPDFGGEFTRSSLYFSSKGKVVRVNHLNALHDITVSSPAAAISLVRLQTSPKTLFCFLEHGTRLVEIIPRSLISKSLFFGDHNFVKSYRRYPQGHMGVIDTNDTELYPAIECQASKGSFLITRCLLEHGRDGKFKCWKIMERVTHQGRYTLLSKKEMKYPRTILWSWNDIY